MTGTVVESRAARWTAALPSTATDARSDSTLLAARARHVAGSAAIQARVAERRGEEATAQLRRVAMAGAAAAAASLGCGALGLVAAVAPDLIAPQLCWAAPVAAMLFCLVPAGLLAAAAMGRFVADDASAGVVASAGALATLGAGFGHAIAAVGAEAPPETARALEALVEVLETAAARVGRPESAAAPARRHRRIVPRERRVVVRTADGRNLIGTIADVSLSGVALTASLPRVAVGDLVTVGIRPAVVARLWERGIAFQFDDELDPATFDEAILL